MRAITVAAIVVAGLASAVASVRAQSGCEIQTAALAKLASDVDMSVDVPDRFVSGDTLEFRWKVPHRFPLKTPVYVLLAVTDDIRLEYTFRIPGGNPASLSPEAREAMDRPPGVIALPRGARAP